MGVRHHSAAVQSSAAPSGRGLAWRRLRRVAAPYILALPAVALVAVFVFGVVNGLAQGLGVMPFLGMTEPTLRYVREALTRPDFVASIGYSVYLALVSAAIALVGGIVLAAAPTRVRAGSATRIAALNLPVMTMHALVAMGVICIFSGSGLAARALHALGLVQTPADFPSVVGDASGWGIIAVYVWKELPYVAFCTVALMANVSSRLGDAAATCGASPLRTFMSVTLPLCAPCAVRAFLVVFAFALGSYEVPFLLGATTPKALPVLAYIEFQDPDIANRCYAMALNGVAALVGACAALAYFGLMVREERRREADRGSVG